MYNAVYITTVTPSPISHVITTHNRTYIEHNSNAHILVGLIPLCISLHNNRTLLLCMSESMKVMIGTWYRCYNYSGVFVSFMYELLANLLAESCEREKDRASQTENVNVTSSSKANHNTFDVLIWTDNLPQLSSFLNSSLQNHTINTLQMYVYTPEIGQSSSKCLCLKVF